LADGALADYGVKGIENERASVGVAGVIGVIGTAVVAGVFFKIIARKPEKNKS
jgi:cobalt/nickel transport protein